ncbi:MAG: T9SS type A sorting domain-containing protein [Ignavibacteriae bacterium]|nr:T9SS type A sorting domain-containing protein [Ignavibacteriota bacterium]
MLLPVSLELQNGIIYGNRRIVRFESERKYDNDTLMIMQFVTMLGSDTIVTVRIDSLNFSSDGCPLAIKSDSVSVKFIDLCTAGSSTRLLTGSPVTQMILLPNPAEESASVLLTLAEESPVTIALHDALGREVMVQSDGVMGHGNHQKSFDCSHLPSGVYSLILSTRSEVKFVQFVKR